MYPEGMHAYFQDVVSAKAKSASADLDASPVFKYNVSTSYLRILTVQQCGKYQIN